MLKKIDKLVSSSFIGPAILSFFVAEFVLIMQFLWKYIDEILGKGFTIPEMLELIFYYGVTLIPLAVPITILISSVMVFGDMAEKYELASMKSAGISLIRIMLPGIVIAILVGLFSLFSSNFLKPASNLQFQKRFIALRKQKSALAIEQGIFNNAFNDFIIRANYIAKNGRDIEDVLIYDHSSSDKSLVNFLSAKKGQMYTAEEGRFFVMKLDSGIQYREMERKTALQGGRTEMPFMRTYFEEWTKTFDMSEFDLDQGLLNFNSRKEDMMNTFQILEAVDSFRIQMKNNIDKIENRLDGLVPLTITRSNQNTDKLDTSFSEKVKISDIGDSYDSIAAVNDTVFSPKIIIAQDIITPDDSSYAESSKDTNKNIIQTTLPGNAFKDIGIILKKDKRESQELKVIEANKKISKPEQPGIFKKLVIQKTNFLTERPDNFISTLDSIDRNIIITQAMSELSRDRDEMVTFKTLTLDNQRSIRKHQLRLHQQYSWAVICLVFLFIGAPMGSIIRKGGYGYPFLVAILFYMLFIISTIMGEKLVKTESVTGIMAAWMPCIILSPFSIILSILALKDRKIDLSFITDWFILMYQKFKFRKSSLN